MQISVSTPMPDDGNCQVIEHLEARPLRARRGWSAEAKARLVEKTLVPGANVSAIARGVGMAPSQLFGWRRQARVARAAIRNEAVDAGYGTDTALRGTTRPKLCGRHPATNVSAKETAHGAVD